MRLSVLSLAVVAVLCAAIAAPAAAQPAPPAAPTTGPSPPTARGVVKHLLLTPRGDIDGLILEDGTQVRTPRHLSTQIAFAVRPGDPVTVEARRPDDAGRPIEAASIADERSGLTVVDERAARPKPGALQRLGRLVTGAPPPVTPEPATVRGTVETTLRAPKGEVEGAVLSDGTIVRMGPEEAEPSADLLRPGRRVEVTGDRFTSVIGRLVRATEITAAD